MANFFRSTMVLVSAAIAILSSFLYLAAQEEKPRFKRRDDSSDEELRRQLQLTPEVGFDQAAASFVLTYLNKLTGNKTVGLGKGSSPTLTATPPSDIGLRFYSQFSKQLKRPDLTSLPWRPLGEIQLGKEPGEGLNFYSVNLRRCMQQALPKLDTRPDAGMLKDIMFSQQRGGPGRPEASLQWNKPESVPALAQMLQTENTSLRIMFVEILANIEGKEASVVLAQRSVFDLSAQVRQKAVGALANRPLKEFQKVLLDAMRWPWQPAADHAAEAIVALQVKEVAPELITMLKEPDPKLPFTKEEKGEKATYINEVVRLNHLSNCLLCHAPSLSRDDLVRGSIPIPGQEMPPLYYGGSTGQFVRADTTFLRQDFSLVQPVANPGKWPGQQRFDYMLRERLANAKEINLLQTLRKENKQNDPYPQRDAVLFALREIIGKDAGSHPEDWLRLLNPVEKKTNP